MLDRQRLVRYEYDGTRLSPVDTLIEDIRIGPFHSGSRLLISPDNYLYMTTGDANAPFLSQDVSGLGKLVGKLLRFHLDGSIPLGNPFAGSPIYSWGHRNAQGLAYGTNGVFYSSEHGPQDNDEINIMEIDRNFGWPNVGGECDLPSEQIYCIDSNIKEPIISWTPTIAPSDLTWYAHPAIPEFNQSLILGTLKTTKLVNIHVNTPGDSVTFTRDYFAAMFGRIRDVITAPDGSIYLASEVADKSILKLYNPNYISSTACEAPTGLTSKAQGLQSVRLSWHAVTGATGYQIRGKRTGGSWVSITLPSNNSSRIFQNLQTDATYVWQVKALCDTTDSNFSGLAFFNLRSMTTCESPDSLYTTNIASSSATLNWQLSQNASGYTIIGGRVNGPQIQVDLQGQLSQFQVSNLASQTAYQWRIQAVCPPEQLLSSALSSIDTFVTLQAKQVVKAPEITYRTSVMAFPNPTQGAFTLKRDQTFDDNIYVYNSQGNLVTTQQWPAGEHFIDIDLSKYPPGIYFVRGNNFQQLISLTK